MIYLDQSDSGSVRFLKAGPLSLFEFVLIAFALYITACLFKSIKTQKLKKKKKSSAVHDTFTIAIYLNFKSFTFTHPFQVLPKMDEHSEPCHKAILFASH